MKRTRANGKLPRESAKVQYCGDVAYVMLDQGEECSVFDGAPEPRDSIALRKALERELKEDLARQKKRLRAIQSAQAKRRRASGRKP